MKRTSRASPATAKSRLRPSSNSRLLASKTSTPVRSFGDNNELPLLRRKSRHITEIPCIALAIIFDQLGLCDAVCLGITTRRFYTFLKRRYPNLIDILDLEPNYGNSLKLNSTAHASEGCGYSFGLIDRLRSWVGHNYHLWAVRIYIGSSKITRHTLREKHMYDARVSRGS